MTTPASPQPAAAGTRETTMPAGRPWWGSWSLVEGETLHWRIGPARLWVQRRTNEWRIARRVSSDALESALELAQPVASEALEEGQQAERFAAQRGESIRLVPAAADRPVVFRPQAPFHLLPREEVCLYVSSPLWLRLQLEPGRRRLLEIPLHRPSDTWVGPSTQSGELCYASVTHCRMDLAELPFRPHRAITAIQIRNRPDAAFRLERLSVPLPYLSLFSDGSGQVWTERITLTREDEEDGLAGLEVAKAPPPEARAEERIGEPRRHAEGALLVRAFNALF